MFTESEPTKYEIEQAVYRLLGHGDEAAIARELGHSPGYVSRLFSPEDEKESTATRFVKELRAVYRRSPERGESILQVVTDMVRRELEGEQLDVITETKKLKHQVDEWESVEMDGAHTQTRIAEIRDIEMQAKRTIKAHGQYLRSMAKTAVETRRNGHR